VVARELRCAFQYHADECGADGAFHSRDEGAHARRAALRLGAALSERSEARVKDDQRARRGSLSARGFLRAGRRRVTVAARGRRARPAHQLIVWQEVKASRKQLGAARVEAAASAIHVDD
jgi:hypothetical protein